MSRSTEICYLFAAMYVLRLFRALRRTPLAFIEASLILSTADFAIETEVQICELPQLTIEQPQTAISLQ